MSHAVSHILEECRMVLPGILALFGFQWIAFFNQPFSDVSRLNQSFHLAATAVVAVAAALLMTPAAYHRTAGGEVLSKQFISLSTRLILAGMFLLGVGVAIDFFVISSFVVPSRAICIGLAGMIWLVLLGLWFGCPIIGARHGPR
ncbi:MAG TPA: DUF6328 family protein [Lacipirellulaceae bacterium]|nr:DUF6328 family protein [Lacipirellulaceae bacterium]